MTFPQLPRVQACTRILAMRNRTFFAALRNALFAVAALGCVVGIAPSLCAQDWAKQSLEKSSRHREWVPIKYGSRTVNAFVVYPEVNSKAPVVIVIHEIFGLSDWARELTTNWLRLDTSPLPRICSRGWGRMAEEAALFPTRMRL